MRMWFRRKEVPWEVVGHKGAQPIPMYDEEDEFNILRVASSEMSYEFAHDLHEPKDMQSAVQTARYQLRLHVHRKGYNMLLSEGWRVTILRKGKKYRAEVVYTGLPAYVTGKVTPQPSPPFMGLLEFYRRDMCNSSL